MKTILYYFTGTGNSLVAAKMLAKSIPDSELMPIAGILLNRKDVSLARDTRVGFIYPMYCGGLPNIVVRFLEKVNIRNASYVFSIITAGSATQGTPVNQIDRLCRKAGHSLDASWLVQMPNNYIRIEGAIPIDKQNEIFAAAREKLQHIAESVLKYEKVIEEQTALGTAMFFSAYRLFMKKLSTSDKKYTVNAKCNSCQICVTVCPVNNILFIESKQMIWLHHCEGCLACLQFCPKHAISCGKITENRKRYHHPYVSVGDMANQKIV